MNDILEIFMVSLSARDIRSRDEDVPVLKQDSQEHSPAKADAAAMSIPRDTQGLCFLQVQGSGPEVLEFACSGRPDKCPILQW